MFTFVTFYLFLFPIILSPYFSIIHRPPPSPLFPYTTLFRSLHILQFTAFHGHTHRNGQQLAFLYLHRTITLQLKRVITTHLDVVYMSLAVHVVDLDGVNVLNILTGDTVHPHSAIAQHFKTNRYTRGDGVYKHTDHHQQCGGITYQSRPEELRTAVVDGFFSREADQSALVTH